MSGAPKTYKYEDHNSWGNSITIFQWPLGKDHERARLSGHVSPPIKAGDLITFNISKGPNKGKTILSKFESVEYQDDPSNMFFATIFHEKVID